MIAKMTGVLISLAPIFIYFIIGYIIKYFDILEVEVGETMLKIVFYVNMPAVILISVANLNLTPNLFFLPIIAAIVHGIIGICSFVTVKQLGYENKKAGVVVVGSLIMSTSFVVPFALVFHSELGVGLLLLFDLGNTIMALSLAYFFAVYYGGDEVEIVKVFRTFFRKLLIAPPFIALIVAIMINVGGLTIPTLILPFLNVLKFLFTPLIMIALGMFFVPKIEELQPFILTISLRTIGGFIIGLIGSIIFGLDGLERTITLIGSSAPVGFVTVAFASIEDLDVKLAANIVSLSAFLGLIIVPLLFIVL